MSRHTLPAEVERHRTYPQTEACLQILTGFLGSGKTTMLNNVLSQDHGRRIAIVENEVAFVAGLLTTRSRLLLSCDMHAVQNNIMSVQNEVLR